MVINVGPLEQGGWLRQTEARSSGFSEQSKSHQQSTDRPEWLCVFFGFKSRREALGKVAKRKEKKSPVAGIAVELGGVGEDALRLGR